MRVRVPPAPQMFIRRGWKKEDHGDLDKRDPFLSYDPGKDGAFCAWKDGHVVRVWPSLQGCIESIVDWVLKNGATTIISETQFMGANPVSILELSYECGLFLGSIEGRVPWDIYIVEVSPSTWQAMQRRRMSDIGIQLDRSDGIELAHRDFLKHVSGTPLAEYYLSGISQREGFSSAHGLGQWWLSHVTRNKDDGTFSTPKRSN